MQFKEVILQSAELAKQKAFYHGKLGLPVVEDSADKLSLQTGASLLTFENTPGRHPAIYHIAFNVPENQLPSAATWLERHTPLIASYSNPTKTIFEFVAWNAHAFYFRDNEGNILEFIARHNLKNASNEPFTAENILEISEVGLPTPDVQNLADQLIEELQLPIYSGAGSDQFTVLGEEQALFILVQSGRPWMPTRDQEALAQPTRVIVEGIEGDFSPADLPYEFVAAK